MITRIYTTPRCTIDFDSSVPCVIKSYTGYMMSEDFRNLNEFALNLIEEKINELGHVGCVIDLSNAEIFSDNDMKWLNEYYNPKVYTIGLRYTALVLPRDAFTLLNMNDYLHSLKLVKNPMVINIFQDIQSAKQWSREIVVGGFQL